MPDSVEYTVDSRAFRHALGNFVTGVLVCHARRNTGQRDGQQL